MSTEPKVLHFEDIEWVDESKNPNAPKELIEKAKKLGAGAQARGSGGGGLLVPVHHHARRLSRPAPQPRSE